jgi:hypothetical protein
MAGVSDRHTYDASIETVQAMFADESFVRTKYEGMGHRDVDLLECSRTDDGLVIRSTRVVEVDLPGFAKRVMKPVNTMSQTDTWTAIDGGGWAGTFEVEVQGAPVHLSGTMRLTSDPGGDSCTHEVTMAMDVKVPLVGGRVRDWAEKNDVPKTLAAEFSAGDAWLADHPG